MNLKEKIIKDKSLKPKIKFNLQNQNCTSIPLLSQFNKPFQKQKQNVFDHINKIQLQPTQMSKSSEFQIRKSINPTQISPSFANLRTQDTITQQGKKIQLKKLSSSHNFANFTKKHNKSLYQSTDFNQHLTFGSVNPINQQPKLTNSRDFYLQKRLKTDSINQIITNIKSSLSKSSNQLSCANHPTKAAKYRLLSELSEGQHQMFYCSKCAINLLQQGFKIQQIKTEDQIDQDQIYRLKSQQIAKLQLKLKSLEERTMAEAQKSQKQQTLNIIQQQIIDVSQQFEDIIQTIHQIKTQQLDQLKQLFLQNENNQKTISQYYNQIIKNIQNAQNQIKNYKQLQKISNIKEDQYQFMISSLTNNIHTYEQMIQTARAPQPLPDIIQTITQQQIIHLLLQRISTPKRSQDSLKSNRIVKTSKNQSTDYFLNNQNKSFKPLFERPSKNIQQKNQKKTAIGSISNSLHTSYY